MSDHYDAPELHVKTYRWNIDRILADQAMGRRSMVVNGSAICLIAFVIWGLFGGWQ